MTSFELTWQAVEALELDDPLKELGSYKEGSNPAGKRSIASFFTPAQKKRKTLTTGQCSFRDRLASCQHTQNCDQIRVC